MGAVEAPLLALAGLALTGLPGIATSLFAVRLGLRSVPVILCLALAVSGAASMLTFWAYFTPPSVAPTGAYLVLFGSLGLAAWSWPAAARNRELLRQLAVPLVLWVLATLFVLGLGFMHGGTEGALGTSGVRFATDPSPFAGDNLIPIAGAEWLHSGHPGSPPLYAGDWQFSDRPPLQAGFLLANWVFGTGMGELRYEAVGVVLQQSWIVAMWALLLAARVPARTRGLAIAAALAGDLAIVNSFYVWPKLLGATFMLAALALLVTPGEPLVKRRPWTMVLLGALCGLAMLSHGSAAFAMPAVLALVLWRGLPERGWVAAGVAALLIAMLPWAGFKQFADPPSNRLLKQSLAGLAAVDERGTVEAIADEYRAAGLAGTLDNKYRNFLTMIGGNPTAGPPPPDGFQFGAVPTELGDLSASIGDGDLDASVSKLREIRQWHLAWLLGLLPLALPLIAFGRLRGAWRDGADWWLARCCLVFVGLSVVVFGLLMFGNGASRALPGSLTYAVPLVAIVGIVAGLRASCPRLADWLVGLNVATTLLLYVPFLFDGGEYSFQPFMAVLAAVCLAAALTISLRAVTPPDPSR